MFVFNKIANPVITKVKVIKTAGLHKFWSSVNESFVKDVPITLPIPIFNIVLVPIGHSPNTHFAANAKYSLAY